MDGSERITQLKQEAFEKLDAANQEGIKKKISMLVVLFLSVFMLFGMNYTVKNLVLISQQMRISPLKRIGLLNLTQEAIKF